MDATVREAARVLDQRPDTSAHAGVGVLFSKQSDLPAAWHQMAADLLFRGGFAASIFPMKP